MTEPISDKADFLRKLTPLFPDVSHTEARLQALQAELLGDEHWQQRHYRAMEEIYFPLWRALAPAYVETLAMSCGSDAKVLPVSVADWPATVAGQQSHLLQLLQTSRLRQGWRDYAQWFEDEFFRRNDQTAKAVAEQVFRRSSAPLREIPLYHGMMRVSCQQLVCLPLAQWQALHDLALPFAPESVDVAVVERLAMRVAQVFNSPPLVDVDLLRDSNGWDGPVVWNTNAGQLTGRIDCHGMHDRCEHGWKGDVMPLPLDAVAPHWRFEGFCGHLRVTLESGENWMVSVLAPVHFVRRLAHSVAWYRRFLS